MGAIVCTRGGGITLLILTGGSGNVEVDGLCCVKWGCCLVVMYTSKQLPKTVVASSMWGDWEGSRWWRSNEGHRRLKRQVEERGRLESITSSAKQTLELYTTLRVPGIAHMALGHNETGYHRSERYFLLSRMSFRSGSYFHDSLHPIIQHPRRPHSTSHPVPCCRYLGISGVRALPLSIDRLWIHSFPVHGASYRLIVFYYGTI